MKVAVDSSINRAHQHAAGARRITAPITAPIADKPAGGPTGHTGGTVE